MIPPPSISTLTPTTATAQLQPPLLLLPSAPPPSIKPLSTVFATESPKSLLSVTKSITSQLHHLNQLNQLTTVTQLPSPSPTQKSQLHSKIDTNHQQPAVLVTEVVDNLSDKKLGTGITLERSIVAVANPANGLHRRRDMKKKDPMSHRIIEKRRRDRMNNCLADLSKLIPSHYIKKGRGRIEKTEIIEMAIKHLKHLMANQPHQNNNNNLRGINSSPGNSSSSNSSTSSIINMDVTTNINNDEINDNKIQSAQNIDFGPQVVADNATRPINQTNLGEGTVYLTLTSPTNQSTLSSIPIAHIAPQPSQNQKQLDFKCSFKSFKKGIKDRFQRGSDFS